LSLSLRARLDAARDRARSIRRQMIALQEELDWRCYRLYGLLDEPLETDRPPEIDLGERAFEIVLARRMARGEIETAWFSRHGSTPITEIPGRWPEDYRRLVERRLALIESDRNIGLVERPEYKRRWSWTPWEDQERDALRGWLLDRLEQVFSGQTPSRSPVSERGNRPAPIADESAPTGAHWGTSDFSRDPGPRGPVTAAATALEPRLTTTARLADALHADAEFLDVAALYAGRVDFDLATLVAELVESEAVPFLPVLRYSESGLRKRTQWEETWRLQRQEDAIDAEVEAEFRARVAGADAPSGRSGTSGSGALAAIPRPPSARGAPPAFGDGTPARMPAERGSVDPDALAAEQRRRRQAEVGDIPIPPK
jgi:hypothetical protein